MKNIITTVMLALPMLTQLYSQEIPKVKLTTQLTPNTVLYSKSILENEIKGIHVEHIALTGENGLIDYAKEGYKTVY